MDSNPVDIDNVFVKGKWIVSVEENGTTKVATCNLDETMPKAGTKWTIIPDNNKNKKETSTKTLEKEQIKSPYEKVVQKNQQFHIGFYLIRDLLNMKKSSSLSTVFTFHNIPVSKVIICGTIISAERKNQHYRLVINDGTSSILCLRKVDEDSHQRKPSYFRNKSQAISFDDSSLGKTVKIVGYLKEYMETNFIFANQVSWISQEGFVDFMEYVVSLYRLKKTILLDS